MMRCSGSFAEFFKKKRRSIASLSLERMKGIEPSRSAWKAEVLPLNYIRMSATIGIIPFFIGFVNNISKKIKNKFEYSERYFHIVIVTL